LLLYDSYIANLASKALKSTLRKRIEGVEFCSLDSVPLTCMTQELSLNEENEKLESHRYNVHLNDSVSNSLNDEKFMLLNFYGLLRIHIVLVHHFSRLVKIGKKN
jgi:hypothetical protein